jgi:hypothetical protein
VGRVTAKMDNDARNSALIRINIPSTIVNKMQDEA